MILDQLHEVVSELGRHDLALLTLKGAHLANCLYEEPGLRPMADLDVLVRAEETGRVRDALVAAGYRPSSAYGAFSFSRHHHQLPLTKEGSVDVEIHHDLVRPGAPFRIDCDGLWSRSDQSESGGWRFLHLSPDDLLLHLCTHAVYDDKLRLGLAASCDIDVTVHVLGEELDWTRLVRTANADGRSGVVYVGLQVAHRLLGTAIPEEALAALSHDSTADQILDEATAYVLDTSPSLPATVRSLDEAIGIGGKARALFRGLFPSPDELRQIYRLGPRGRTVYLYYLVRPFTLLLRRGPEFLGLTPVSPRGHARLVKDRRRRRIEGWLAHTHDSSR